MQLIHCDGCRKREPISTSPDSKDIIPVRFTMSPELRSWEQDTTLYAADLCSTCRTTLLAKFFGIPSEQELDIPAFMSRIPAA